MNNTIRSLAVLAALFTAVPVLAQVKVRDAWVRGTVAQQKATGAFMQLTASEDAKLIKASSPVAGVVEIHEMTMDGNVMRMRAIPALELPAHRTVELRPGGYHVMLMDLMKPLAEGEMVPLRLTVETRDGKRSTIELQAPVRPLTEQGGHTTHGHK